MNNEVDLTKLANAEVFEKDPEMKKVLEEQKNTVPVKKKKSKFSFTTASKVRLPSEGRFYNTEDPDINEGYILIRPMTVKEEGILSDKKLIKEGIATRIVLDNCIESDIDAQDLLSFDSNYLLFYLRGLSYGNEYDFEIKCSNEMCENIYKHTIKISDIKFKAIPKDIKEPIVVKLPLSKYTVEVILPRVYHSEKVYRESKGISSNFISLNYVARTYKVTDDKGKLVPKSDWSEFYEALPSLDKQEIKKLTDLDDGVEEIVNGVSCPECGTEYKGGIPFNEDFFRI